MDVVKFCPCMDFQWTSRHCRSRGLSCDTTLMCMMARPSMSVWYHILAPLQDSHPHINSQVWFRFLLRTWISSWRSSDCLMLTVFASYQRRIHSHLLSSNLTIFLESFWNKVELLLWRRKWNVWIILTVHQKLISLLILFNIDEGGRVPLDCVHSEWYCNYYWIPSSFFSMWAETNFFSVLFIAKLLKEYLIHSTLMLPITTYITKSASSQD